MGGIVYGYSVSSLCSHSAYLKENCAFYVLGDYKTVLNYKDQISSFSPKVLVIEEGLKKFFKEFNTVEVKNTRLAYRLDCEEFYKDLFKRFYFIGITGTKGKTSIAYWLNSALNSLGTNSAYIGTLGVLANQELKKSKNTSPGLQELIIYLEEFKKQKISHIVYEVSSQGLDQERIPINYFKLRLFTDLSEEHLDHHKSMQNYLNSKLKFFNSGDYLALILDRTKYKDSILHKDKKYYGLLGFGSLAKLCFKDSFKGFSLENKDFSLKTNFMGFFNAENILAVYESLVYLGFQKEVILNTLSKLPQVPGRMQKIIHQSGALIFIDYAHSAQALEFVLESVKNLRPKRLSLVFGCGGDRDPSKRARMGEAANKYANQIYLTSDNPRTEDPIKIMQEVKQGIKDLNKLVFEPDRKLAIKKAVSSLSEGEVLLVCGKGHEDYQILGNKTIHFSDLEEVEALCQI